MTDTDFIKPEIQAKFAEQIVPRENYWDPLKNGLSYVWNDIILGHIWIVLLIVAIVVILIYRYQNKTYYRKRNTSNSNNHYVNSGPYVKPSARALVSEYAKENLEKSLVPQADDD